MAYPSFGWDFLRAHRNLACRIFVGRRAELVGRGLACPVGRY